MKDYEARFVGVMPTVTLILISGERVFLEEEEGHHVLPSIFTSDLVASVQHQADAEILAETRGFEGSSPVYVGTFLWRDNLEEERPISIVYRLECSSEDQDGDFWFSQSELPSNMLEDERRLIASFAPLMQRAAQHQ